MILLKPGNALSAVIVLALAGAVVGTLPHVSPAPVATRAPAFDATAAEIRLCQADAERAYDECVEEVTGKALIQRAERLSRSGVR